MRVPLQLQGWAARWNVSAECLADLLQLLGVSPPPPATPPPNRAGEAWTQSVVRLEAPRHGIQLFRNNVGAWKERDPDTGSVKRVVRYGLMNDSQEVNERWKSGDLVGLRPVLITPAHVGHVIGQFVSRECKHPGWTWSGDQHEMAQLAWAGLIMKNGGDARFATGEGSFTNG